jgi:glyoxylase-like metal-dependent hydrolase (beta-lactamase superfamily II)
MQIHTVVVGELSTNCYIVVSKGKKAFVVDPGDEAPVLLEFLNRHGIQAIFVVNTHGHIDHIKADAALKLPVWIHEKDAPSIISPDNNLMASFFGTFDPVRPARLLVDGDKVELDELSFTVIHTPGHTPGGICLSGEGVLFSGDTLFRDGVGRTDFPGASAAVLRRSLEKLAGLEPATAVYPGHGPATTIGRELA